MPIHCPNCGAPFNPAGSEATTCAFCGTAMATAQTATLPVRMRTTPLPERFVVTADQRSLLVRWRWLGVRHVAMAIFSFIWWRMLSFFYAIALGIRGNLGWLFLLLPIGHIAVGVAMTYAAIAGFFNSTELKLQGGLLTIVHGPLPWPGQRSVGQRTLTQLFTRERANASSDDGEQTFTYELWAIDSDGRELSLLKGLEKADQARWLEEELEARLGIVDRPVRGELAKSTG